MLDSTDKQILQCLQSNSRSSWKEIGKMVHLTGQAVAARIRRMQEMGIIEAFTVKINHQESCKPLWAFINVFMKSSDHPMFQNFILKTPSIVEAHRISGEGCYWLKANLADQQELNALLDKILVYGNYKLTLSIGQLKS